jgi:S-adenosylmethionine hydrolase
MKQSLLPQPVIRENGRYLIGSVIYVDRFGNLVTNLHQKQVAEVEQRAKPHHLTVKRPKDQEDTGPLLRRGD